MNRVESLHSLEHQIQAIEGIKSVRCEDNRYLLIKTSADDVAVIFLIDRPLSARALRNACKYNTVNAIHSLFILDEMLLPNDGTRMTLPPYLGILQTLYHQLLYGYRVENGQVVVFPVQLSTDGSSTQKSAHYLPPIQLENFTCGCIETGYPISGFWATAYFAHKVEWEPPDLSQPRHHSFGQLPTRGVMKVHYDMLGVPYDADISQIKQAYRQLARLYHPDYNPSPNATDQMQALNQAYKELMRKFE